MEDKKIIFEYTQQDSDKENQPVAEGEAVGDCCYELIFNITDKFFTDDCTISELSDIIAGMTVELNIFMNKLSKLNPERKMIGEIKYWRRMWDILTPAKELIDSEDVKAVTGMAFLLVSKIREAFNTIPADQLEITEGEHNLVKTVEGYQKQQSRLSKGYKEALWNDKYMSLLENQVLRIEESDDLSKISWAIVPLMSSLKNIYESSNFYKEARIISFIDHLYLEVIEKINSKIPDNALLLSNIDLEEFETTYEYAIEILEKFKNKFFIEEMLKNSKNEINTMDFLNFIRPDTRYSDTELMYGRTESGVSTPHYLSQDQKTTKWEDLLNLNTFKRVTKLEPIPESRLDTLEEQTPCKNTNNPRQKMRDELKEKGSSSKSEK